MQSYIVTITDHRGTILRQFESVGSYGQARAAGNLAAFPIQRAAAVVVKAL